MIGIEESIESVEADMDRWVNSPNSLSNLFP
jgi:hypothetical protein